MYKRVATLQAGAAQVFPMDFSLSPVPNPEDWDSYYRARHKVKEHSEQAYTNFKEGNTVVDFLALEEPPIKKRLQRQAQRARKLSPKKRHLRSWRSVCMVRAQAWLEIYQAPFIVDGNKLYRREIREDGKEHIGAHGAVVGLVLTKPERKKDRSLSRQAPFMHNPLFEEQVLKVSNHFDAPVPEPTPIAFEHHTVHGARKKNLNVYPVEEKLTRNIFSTVCEK
jgi:hypothetical protein